ncbi:MAG: FAD-binding oxidoreductase [Holophagaceae bacterium]|nr:FAD-binding oxidoreductase [Holophagaceae bacterium]
MNNRFPSIPNASIIELPTALEGYRRDESHIIGSMPLAVVKPHRPDALRKLVSIANGEGYDLVPRGTGTGKAGGATPTEKSIIVDMSEYPGQIQISHAELALWAPASALLRDVKESATLRGLYYPPDPNSWDQCSFGGTLATNAGGVSACKYGMTRHWVLSVDALMEDGEIHRFGIETVKNNAGPNIAQLLVGSEGIFGIITGASVRLIPATAERLTLLLPVSHWGDLLELPEQLITQGLLPRAFEFWDPDVLQYLRQHGSGEAKRLPGEALAILEFDDLDCTGNDFICEVLNVLGSLSEYVQVATDVRQREVVWNVRRQTSVVLKEQFPHKISEDIAVPRHRVKAFFDGVKQNNIPIVTYGHLGDGNLHVNILAPNSPSDLEHHLNALFRLTLDLGGTLTGEHGIGLAKREAFLAFTDPWQIQAIRKIKQALDPNGIFNRGKVV